MPPTTPKTRRIRNLEETVKSAQTANAKLTKDKTTLGRENESLKHDLQNAKRREKRHKKQVQNLKKKVKVAEAEVDAATAEAEARVREVLKRKVVDEKGFLQRIREIEVTLNEAEFRYALTNKQLTDKINELKKLRAVLKLAERQ
ncbi:hypothetical protein C8F01DRAFT_1083791 [Mycena amicta]|nr:hypothetical protein C8F01DRAFT_1083791 [Mycena amicta]